VFSGLLVICSWISIPFFVPLTLQTFGVFTALLFLGGPRGFCCITLYIAMGLIGLPVFSGFKNGLAVFSGPTGGYVIGFLCLAGIFWAITEKFGKSASILPLALLFGLVACHLSGYVWMVFIWPAISGTAPPSSLLGFGTLSFLIADLIKLWLSVIILNRANRFLGKSRAK